MTQAAENLAGVDRGISELANTSSSQATRSAVQAAAASLEQFRALDKRARQYVQNNQSLMASDVIFTESLGALTTAVEHVGAAAENERAIRAAESDGLRARQLMPRLARPVCSCWWFCCSSRSPSPMSTC